MLASWRRESGHFTNLEPDPKRNGLSDPNPTHNGDFLWNNVTLELDEYWIFEANKDIDIESLKI